MPLDGLHIQQEQQQHGGPPAPTGGKFLVSLEEEEFLRSLGWSDAEDGVDGVDDALTEEEIQAFRSAMQGRPLGVQGQATH
jgi:hypothetical protein